MYKTIWYTMLAGVLFSQNICLGSAQLYAQNIVDDYFAQDNLGRMSDIEICSKLLACIDLEDAQHDTQVTIGNTTYIKYHQPDTITAWTPINTPSSADLPTKSKKKRRRRQY